MTVLGSLTTAEWIVAVVSGLVFLVSMIPLVWLTWCFVQMDDAAVAREIEHAQLVATSKDELRRKLAA
jgi:hypothetical protein